MNSRGAGELGDANDGVFDVAGRDHHEVGELVDDNEKVRVFAQDAFTAGRNLDSPLGHRAVVVVDVFETERVQVVVPHVHLFDDPLQRLGGFFRVGDDGRDEVRNALVRRELDALGVDENHADFGGSRPHQQRRDHRVDERRLSRARRTRDEKVRHLGEVRDDKLALDVFSDTDRHRVAGGDGRG